MCFSHCDASLDDIMFLKDISIVVSGTTSVISMSMNFFFLNIGS